MRIFIRDSSLKLLHCSQELGVFVVEIFEPLQRYRKNLISVLLAEKMALYTCQLCTSFGMLVEVIQEQHQLRAPIFVRDFFFHLLQNTEFPFFFHFSNKSLGWNHFIKFSGFYLKLFTWNPRKSVPEKIESSFDFFLFFSRVNLCKFLFHQSAKKYVCDRLCWCFKMIIEVLDASSPTEEEENFEKENHFVYR